MPEPDDPPPTPSGMPTNLGGLSADELLARGGMGAVFKARQMALDRCVAIKLLPLEISVDQNFVERFRREARAMAKLNHPNIIAVHDFGQTAEGHLFFVMEFVEGANLLEIIQQDGLDAEQALALTGQVCTALAYAHGKGVVHRDIKPANVMMDQESQVKVADFGLARLTNSGAEASGTTMTGIVMGTPDYMAPEQKRGMNVDQRADIYSVGVMLYEMLCRKVPHGVFALPSQVTGCDARIDQIVLRAMQQEVELRYQSTQEMKVDVDGARMPSPMTVPAPQDAAAVRSKSSSPQAEISKPVPASRSSAPLWITSIVALVLLLGVGAYVSKRHTKAVGKITAPPAASTKTGGEEWHDWVAERRRFGIVANDGHLTDDGTRLRVIKDVGADVSLSDKSFRNASVRTTSSLGKNQIILKLRKIPKQGAEADASRDGTRYEALIGRTDIIISVDRHEAANAAKTTRMIKHWRVPPSFDMAKEFVFELRAIDDRLTVLLNEQEIGSIQDDSIREAGRIGFYADEGTIIHKMEYRSFDALMPAANIPPATATKDAPPAPSAEK